MAAESTFSYGQVESLAVAVSAAVAAAAFVVRVWSQIKFNREATLSARRKASILGFLHAYPGGDFGGVSFAEIRGHCATNSADEAWKASSKGGVSALEIRMEINRLIADGALEQVVGDRYRLKIGTDRVVDAINQWVAGGHFAATFAYDVLARQTASMAVDKLMAESFRLMNEQAGPDKLRLSVSELQFRNALAELARRELLEFSGCDEFSIKKWIVHNEDHQ